MENFRKHYIDGLVVKLIEFYNRPLNSNFIGYYFSKNDEIINLSDKEKEYFLEKVNLSKLLNTDSSQYISVSITDPSKYHFGIYLLASFPFPLEVNKLDSKNNSLFQI